MAMAPTGFSRPQEIFPDGVQDSAQGVPPPISHDDEARPLSYGARGASTLPEMLQGVWMSKGIQIVDCVLGWTRRVPTRPQSHEEKL